VVWLFLSAVWFAISAVFLQADTEPEALGQVCLGDLGSLPLDEALSVVAMPGFDVPDGVAALNVEEARGGCVEARDDSTTYHRSASPIADEERERRPPAQPFRVFVICRAS
jgi:hypothetical protein